MRTRGSKSEKEKEISRAEAEVGGKKACRLLNRMIWERQLQRVPGQEVVYISMKAFTLRNVTGLQEYRAFEGTNDFSQTIRRQGHNSLLSENRLS